MNDLSNAAATATSTKPNPLSTNLSTPNPIPNLAIFVLIALFLFGFGVSLFILVLVHNAFFLVFLLLLFAFIFTFILCNSLPRRRLAALLFFLRSFPESDLAISPLGQLVKISGPVSCGEIKLESSYEKVAPCIYTSTSLYECKEFGSRLPYANDLWFLWRLTYSERFCTDFYISDEKSGITVLVKAGFGCNVIPLMSDSRLVNTTTKKSCILSRSLKKWRDNKGFSNKECLVRLEEGYIKEGSLVTVVGILHRENEMTMIVESPEPLTTGCMWRRLLVPIEFDGIILGVPETCSAEEDAVQCPPQ